MPLITDRTMQEIAEEIGRKNAILLRWINNYTPTSWLSVQADVRAGKAKAKYAIGDELICKYTYNGTEYNFPWVVLDNDRKCVWEDQSVHDGLWLGAKYATIEDVPFDAPEGVTVDLSQEPNAVAGWYYWGVNGTTYTALNLAAGAAIPTTYGSVVKATINHVDAARYGYNRYSRSAFRQWLNSAANAGAWWTPQHTGDVAPSQAGTLKGFMAGLDSDFVNVITPVRIQAACNTVTDGGATDVMYDRFFLQSLEEVYGAPQIGEVEGPYFPYWKQVTGLPTPKNGSSTDTNEARKIRRINNPSGSAASVRLRSASRGTSYYAWYVYSTGYLVVSGYASNAHAALPACVIS